MKPRRSEESGRRLKSKEVIISPPQCKKDKVIARWTDGLFYIIKILKICERRKKCLVEFEDQSTSYVDFKHLLKEKSGESHCHICGSTEQSDSDAFVTCVNCDRDYHQQCHVPTLSEEDMNGDFSCRICVFAMCAQAGGAKTTGPYAEKLDKMKRYLPYNLRSLTWNKSGMENEENIFCYCGGPGIWYRKMLQCCRCRQWFHEACLQCLDAELLVGDHFFLFACAHCNYGQEFLHRLAFTWEDVIHISLFHLTITTGSKYADLDTDLAPFIMKFSRVFRLQQLLNGLHLHASVVREEVLNVIKKNSFRFCCGTEMKKKCTWFGLRERLPPTPPPVQIPLPSVKITKESFLRPGSKTHTFVHSKSQTPLSNFARAGSRTHPSPSNVKLKEKEKEIKIANVKNEHNYCSHLLGPMLGTNGDDSPPPLGAALLPDSNNNTPTKEGRVKTEPGVEAGEAGLDMESGKENFWSLNTAIPEPEHFRGINNPFLTWGEQEDLKHQRQLLGKQLDHLAAVFGSGEEKTLSSMSPLDVRSPGAKSARGFKGELAQLVKAASPVVPKPSKSSPVKSQGLTPEKMLDKISQRSLTTSPRTSRSPSTGRAKEKVRPLDLDSTSVMHVNGVKIAPVKNGCLQKQAEAEKRMLALSRCLKNLSPSCGFRFPVLSESHPAVVNNQVSSSPAADSPASLSKNSHRGSKRKRIPSGEVAQVTEVDAQHSSPKKNESIRRSHRSRHAVNRFESAFFNLNPELRKTAHTNSNILNEARYNIISLRVCPDQSVEYLVDWRQ